nr:PREDICTED: uncharacterized protein LOC108952163 [Musa acuminata subsp. malaccensis]
MRQPICVLEARLEDLSQRWPWLLSKRHHLLTYNCTGNPCLVLKDAPGFGVARRRRRWSPVTMAVFLRGLGAPTHSFFFIAPPCLFALRITTCLWLVVRSQLWGRKLTSLFLLRLLLLLLLPLLRCCKGERHTRRVREREKWMRLSQATAFSCEDDLDILA